MLRVARMRSTNRPFLHLSSLQMNETPYPSMPFCFPGRTQHGSFRKDVGNRTHTKEGEERRMDDADGFLPRDQEGSMPMETNEMETNQDEKDASVRLRRPSIGKEDDNRGDARANGDAGDPNGNRQTKEDGWKGWQASIPSTRYLPDSLEIKSQPLEKSTCQPLRCFVSRVSYKHPVEMRGLPSSGGANEHMRSTCKCGGPST